MEDKFRLAQVLTQKHRQEIMSIDGCVPTFIYIQEQVVDIIFYGLAD